MANVHASDVEETTSAVTKEVKLVIEEGCCEAQMKINLVLNFSDPDVDKIVIKAEPVGPPMLGGPGGGSHLTGEDPE